MILSSFLPYVSGFCGVALAIGVLLRARRTLPDWMFATGLAVLAAENVCSGLTTGAVSPERIIYWQQWRLLILSLLPGPWLVFSLGYARGNAREFLNKWRLPLTGAFLLPVLITVFFHEHLLGAIVETDSGSRWIVRLGWSGLALYGFVLTGSVFVLMNLERTFRASVGIMRWRIKFMILGLGVLFTVQLYTSSQILLFREYDPALQAVNSSALLVAAGLMLRSFFRTWRFDMDVYPSQSVLQGSLTFLLAGSYLLVIGVFAKIAAYFGGDQTFALKSFLGLVSLVLLTVLLQSDRARLTLHRFISRHFQRPIYDYRTVWRSFTEGTATRVEQTDLCRSLVRLVADMFQILSVSLWLLDDDKETLTLAASTTLSERQSLGIDPQETDINAIVRHFQLHPGPADIEGSRSPWAAALRQWHPEEFPNGGHRICVPLVGRGELIGLITLGDRVGGAAYSLQDFDMLKCVGDHASASLLNVQLSQKLLQAKEREAFQTMAAFFVHDLKNSAATLNLMLQNLPMHFDDPAFREDALRGVGKSVAHINHLISRLSQFRHELKISPKESDLNEVVAGVVAGFETETGFVIEQSPGAVPRLPLDCEQFSKVMTNLILNAREAMAGSGRLKLATSQTNGWALLSATDHGCGMSPEFLSRSLFRPFQTTKQNGLGIGMFQTKMIVEAHGGRIAVESTPGRGTTFRVFLPLRPRSSAQ